MNPVTPQGAIPTVCIRPAHRPDCSVPGGHPSNDYELALASARLIGPIREPRPPDARAVACAWRISCHTQTVEQLDTVHISLPTLADKPLSLCFQVSKKSFAG